MSKPETDYTKIVLKWRESLQKGSQKWVQRKVPKYLHLMKLLLSDFWMKTRKITLCQSLTHLYICQTRKGLIQILIESESVLGTQNLQTSRYGMWTIFPFHDLQESWWRKLNEKVNWLPVDNGKLITLWLRDWRWVDYTFQILHR
jgi:hypothetical protein